VSWISDMVANVLWLQHDWPFHAEVLTL